MRRGHGHHGHHGHHGYRGGLRRWGGGWYPNDYYLYSTPYTCPPLYSPVLATDNRVYDNECLALAAGQAVVKRFPGGIVHRPGFSGAEVVDTAMATLREHYLASGVTIAGAIIGAALGRSRVGAALGAGFGGIAGAALARFWL